MLTETAVDAIVTITELKIDDRVACYEKVDIDESRLKAYVGTPYQQVGNDVWSYPADVDNLKYLIRQSGDGALSLWVFSSFVVSDGDTYTYGDVLRVIYGVDSAEEIVCITAAPSKSNNTDLGRRIQKEVGTHTYTDAEDLAAFYGIAVDVKCFGADSESIGDPNRFTYSFSTDEQDKLTSGESTYATRVFSITLANGTTIDSWRYDALQGCFFEFGGIFTEPLPAEAVEILNRMFGIE